MLREIATNPRRTVPQSTAEHDRSSAHRIRAANPQLSGRTTEFWTAVAERSGDTAFRTWPWFQKRRGAPLPAAVHILWLRRRPPAARQASSRQPGAAAHSGLCACQSGTSADILPTAPGANPEGCQRVAGGRSGQGGNDHRKTCFGTAHPGGVPDVASIRTTPARMTGLSEISLVPQPGCRPTPAPLSGGRRPQDPRRPPATLCQPFGLTRPECPNPSGPVESAILLATYPHRSESRLPLAAVLPPCAYLDPCGFLFARLHHHPPHQPSEPGSLGEPRPLIQFLQILCSVVGSGGCYMVNEL